MCPLPVIPLSPSLPLRGLGTHRCEGPASVLTILSWVWAPEVSWLWVLRSRVLELLSDKQITKQISFIHAREGPVGLWISEQLLLANIYFFLNAALSLWSLRGAQMAGYQNVAKSRACQACLVKPMKITSLQTKVLKGSGSFSIILSRWGPPDVPPPSHPTNWVSWPLESRKSNEVGKMMSGRQVLFILIGILKNEVWQMILVFHAW